MRAIVHMLERKLFTTSSCLLYTGYRSDMVSARFNHKELKTLEDGRGKRMEP